MLSNDADALPPAITAVLQLFEGPLLSVAFPDVNGGVLDRAALVALATQTRAAQATLAAARAALVEAQAALVAAEAAVLSAEGALTAKAQRALGYARVYAEGDVELTRALAAVDVGSRRVPGRDGQGLLVVGEDVAPRRRGRPRKVDVLARDVTPGAGASDTAEAELVALA